MSDSLFRKQSLDHISTPDNLHNYIHVTNPRLWMLLLVILALLVGIMVQIGSTTIEDTIPIKVRVMSYESSIEYRKSHGNRPYYTMVTGKFPLHRMDELAVGMELRIGDERGKLNSLNADAQKGEVFLYFDMEHEYISMKNGVYDAVIVLESTKAINYLFQ